MEWIGYLGLAAFALAWVPQSVETIRAGRCEINATFLFLAALGSLALMTHALLRGDAVFSLVNALTTLGALVNIRYKLRPRAGLPARAVPAAVPPR